MEYFLNIMLKNKYELANQRFPFSEIISNDLKSAPSWYVDKLERSNC